MDNTCKCKNCGKIGKLYKDRRGALVWPPRGWYEARISGPRMSNKERFIPHVFCSSQCIKDWLDSRGQLPAETEGLSRPRAKETDNE